MNHLFKHFFSIHYFFCALISLSYTSYTAAQTNAVQQSERWAQTAKVADPAFKASSVRGQGLFAKSFTHNKDMPSCTSCHTANLADQGKHVITQKTIAPMVSRGASARFTDEGKTDKWLKRNCGDVVGRDCTAAEKADLLAFFSMW